MLIPLALILACYGRYSQYFIRAILSRMQDLGSGEGKPFYLLGELSDVGWWYYYPLAALVKVPLLTLVVGAAGLVKFPRGKSDTVILFTGSFLLLLIPSMLSHKQVGYRYLLPLSPMLCVFGGAWLAELWKTFPKKSVRFVVAGTILILGAESARVAPHYLSYFNVVAGGPSHGSEWLLDSNLDWGQDLPALREEWLSAGKPELTLSYFGTAFPDRWGIVQTPFYSDDPKRENHLDPNSHVRWFAISATKRPRLARDVPGFSRWFQTHTPIVSPGYSIFVYNISADTEIAGLFSRYYLRNGQDTPAKIWADRAGSESDW